MRKLPIGQNCSDIKSEHQANYLDSNSFVFNVWKRTVSFFLRLARQKMFSQGSTSNDSMSVINTINSVFNKKRPIQIE